ncbi:bifunctional DNA primase/polymerase [Rhodanobacter thiooxydans]|jgi:hypothetical protein|uniref:bifunctional DNA primase/polymerase n=1 Tax=Rhodanobacter thiooxydans TaxID=416169 RepID=UPI000D3C41E8|nr:bifunctional DNA primase/polymerase [Rhodanobacter thiooxydans]
MNNLEYAAQLAAAGWRVHPLRPGSKLPMLPGWQNAATNDAATVAAWWTETPAAGIGIATGAPVIVLDVDTNGKPGAESLAALIAEHGPLPQTLTARTASGGFHYYFSTSEPIRNSADKVGKALDVRGAGGYVVAPPTVVDGCAYQWADLSPIAPAPAWLIAAALAPVADRPATSTTIEPTPELLADLADALTVLDADSRDQWIAAGAALRSLGEAGRELWVSWSATSDKHNADTDPDTFETIGHDSTGPAAIFAAAARNGWQNPAAMRRASELFGHQPLPINAPTGPTLQAVQIADVMGATVAPPQFIVNPLIPAGHLTLFGSHGGSGKSILALAIGAHVAAGQPWAGLTVQHRPVLFVSLEDAAEIVRYRLRKIIEGYQLDAAAVLAGLTILDGSAGLSALMTEHAAFGVRSLVPTATLGELRAAVGGAGLIILDNASDAYDGPENDRRQVRTFIRELAGLGRANDAGVMLLAHIDKAAARFGSQGNSYSGSSAWHNSARSRLALVDTRIGKELVQEKLNLGAKAAPIRLAWTPSGVLIPDRAEYIDGAAGSDADAVLAAIVAAVADGVNVPAARSGPATTQRVLENLPDLPASLRGARGREDFWAAITDLQRSGRIVVEEYLNDSRHRREKFSVAPVRQLAPVVELAQTSELAPATRASAPVPGAGVQGE